MSAAFVPTLTRVQERDGPAAALRLANLVINFLLVVVSAICLVGILTAPCNRANPGARFRRGPRQARADHAHDPDHDPVPGPGLDLGRGHGIPQYPPGLLHPRHRADHAQHRADRVGVSDRAALPPVRIGADRGDGDRGAPGRTGAARDPDSRPALARVPLDRRRLLPRPRRAAHGRAHDARRGRNRRGPGEQLREHVPGFDAWRREASRGSTTRTG